MMMIIVIIIIIPTFTFFFNWSLLVLSDIIRPGADPALSLVHEVFLNNPKHSQSLMDTSHSISY